MPKFAFRRFSHRAQKKDRHLISSQPPPVKESIVFTVFSFRQKTIRIKEKEEFIIPSIYIRIMDFCPLFQKDVFALKTENTEIGVKGISTRRQKHANRTRLRKSAQSSLCFRKNAFTNGSFRKNPPTRLENAFIRLYLCIVATKN
jgi:hypothetical protein